MKLLVALFLIFIFVEMALGASIKHRKHCRKRKHKVEANLEAKTTGLVEEKSEGQIEDNPEAQRQAQSDENLRAKEPDEKSEEKLKSKPRRPCKKKPKAKTEEKAEDKPEVSTRRPCKKPKPKAEDKPEDKKVVQNDTKPSEKTEEAATEKAEETIKEKQNEKEEEVSEEKSEEKEQNKTQDKKPAGKSEDAEKQSEEKPKDEKSEKVEAKTRRPCKKKPTVKPEEKSEEKPEVTTRRPCKKPKPKSDEKTEAPTDAKSGEKAEELTDAKSDEKADGNAQNNTSAELTTTHRPRCKKPKPKTEENNEQKAEQKNETQTEVKPRPKCKKPKGKSESEGKNETASDAQPLAQPETAQAEQPSVVQPETQPTAQPSDDELGFNGHLYDVFQKHLTQVFQDLFNNVTYNPYAGDQIKSGVRKRESVGNCLYEEFKRRLDKFNNEFVMQPAKSFKRMSSAADGGNGEKRSTVQESLYEEYKKRMDKLGNELALDGEKVFDRSGRGAVDVYRLLLRKRASVKAHINPNNPDFYEQYKNRLNELTRELYEKSNERIHRAYARLGDDDMDSPTLQRWVLAKQSTTTNNDKSNLMESVVPLQRNSRSQKQSKKKEAKLSKPDVQIGSRFQPDSKRSLSLGDIGSSIFSGGDGLPYGTSATAAASASYPSVLTKALESNIGMIGSTSPKNLLASVAQKMNMTTLELAKKLASMSSPAVVGVAGKRDSQQLADLQKVTDLAVNQLAALGPETKSATPSKKTSPVAPTAAPQTALQLALSGVSGQPSASGQPATSGQSAASGQPAASEQSAIFGKSSSKPSTASTTVSPTTSTSTTLPPPICTTPCASESESSRIAYVLEKVLSKLERLQLGKESSEDGEVCEPDGVPCDVTGSWNSYTMGLRFDISVGKAADRRLGLAERNNKLLQIEVNEHVPPRPHHIIGTNWKFMGSALNQHGGPFYIYSQNRDESVVATFTGYCRSCNKIDTIFGSWTIMGPSKDCEDVTTALETKRDIFRRFSMENKRKQRVKNMLFEKSQYGKGECD